MKKIALSKTLLTTSALFSSAFLFAACAPQQSAPLTPTPVDETSPTTTSQAQMEAAPLADGEVLTTTETYQSPAGPEDVKFTLVIDDEGVIVDAVTQVLAKNSTSIMRQEAFAADFPAALEGKKLASLTEIDRVGGSSLTTKSFNEAIATFQQMTE